MSDQKSKDDLIGKKLGQFTILEEVGRGGMATVYKATQQSMNRTVAVKVLPRHFMHDPGFIERFEREVDVISKLEHPHILPIYDYGEQDGAPYIAMRFLGGGSMTQMIRRGTISLSEIERPLSQIASALDYAHQHGVIHRDLKPGNIMLDENGNAYLSDFGIAHVAGSELTGSALIGTPAYMSPEQANGVAIDHRSDIYALGIVLFELIAGREPFQAETPMALLLKHISEPVPQVRNFREGVPDEIEEVIALATAKDPDERYSTAGEMSQGFTMALHQTGEITRPAVKSRVPKTSPGIVPESRTEVVNPEMSAALKQIVSEQIEEQKSHTTAVGQSSAAQTGSTSRWVALVLIVAILVVGGVVALTIINNTNRPPDRPQTFADFAPTPFRRAMTIQHEDYTISMPQAWVPVNQFIDQSDLTRLVHIWQANDDTAFVTLSIVDSAMSVESYQSRYYDSQVELKFIDEADPAPDGTIRQSYRMEGNSRWGNGQIDVFYVREGDKMGVLELFTADQIAADETIITTLQLILDSIRLNSESS